MATVRTKVIVNPVAGARSTRRKWPIISRLLERIGLTFDFDYTEGVGHAMELARIAASDGYRYLVAVGGDGTVNEVANGILHSTNASTTTLGVVSTGTGSDFARSAGLARDYTTACANLTSSKRLTIDVGLVEYQRDGKRQERFFVNSAGVGFDAAVVKETERLPKFFGGTIPYVAGMLRALVSYKNKDIVLKVGDEEESRRVLNVAVANGNYCGGGMRIAPEAKLDDRLLDVVIIGDMGKLELLKEFPTVYKGTHINHPKVSMRKVTNVSIESAEPMLVYADGEMLGECPASFRVVPATLSLVV
ncbi:MAG: diacylglycerol kinase family lipid kinase [Dehalococcoidales bacterium]|nr:diacylglycerol kinase family lipid kinase [Dehalococcoidales bacterium]